MDACWNNAVSVPQMFGTFLEAVLLDDIGAFGAFVHKLSDPANFPWGTLLVLALLQVLANKLYKTYREKIFNTW